MTRQNCPRVVWGQKPYRKINGCAAAVGALLSGREINTDKRYCKKKVERKKELEVRNVFVRRNMKEACLREDSERESTRYMRARMGEIW